MVSSYAILSNKQDNFVVQFLHAMNEWDIQQM